MTSPMKRTVIFAMSICFCLGSCFTLDAQARKRQTPQKIGDPQQPPAKASPPKQEKTNSSEQEKTERKSPFTDWGAFLRELQCSIGDESMRKILEPCKTMSTDDVFTWEGVYEGIKDKAVSIKMSDKVTLVMPGKIVDVSGGISGEASNPQAWAALRPGQKVRFRTKGVVPSPIDIRGRSVLVLFFRNPLELIGPVDVAK